MQSFHFLSIFCYIKIFKIQEQPYVQDEVIRALTNASYAYSTFLSYD